jgi:peptidoglycan/xylan/chitin deacetylase (PgdA/CDA1 family)
MRIPVLTYHSMTVHGNEYRNNDHVAFRDDLRTLKQLGYRIASADRVVAWHSTAGKVPASAGKFVAITFDDGPDFDFHDLPHPTWGMQRSMLNLMKDFRAEVGMEAQPGLHATSFVIVSPDARQILDRTCMVGRDWWRDTWWQPAIESGLLGIANHSWDHNHPTLPSTVSGEHRGTGSFIVIDDFDAAEGQIAKASRFLHARAENPAAGLFAYPYGEANDYLRREYLPLNGERIGVHAAFACAPMPVTETSDRWALPRYVHGDDWKSPDELVALLRDASGT